MKLLHAVLPGMLAVGFAFADDNAALRSRGARISITSANKARPINARWNKPAKMLSAGKPAGPIIHQIHTAEITIHLALPLTVTQVGIQNGDYKGGFAMARDFTLEAPGQDAKSYTLTQNTKKVQFFPYSAKTDKITIKVTSKYPPKNGKKPNLDYGTINCVKVLVKEDLKQLFAPPETYVRGLPTYSMRTPNLDPQGFTGVIGEPRKATGHPCTIWDKQDLARFKKEIATYPAAKDACNGIVAFAEKACTLNWNVPDKPDDGVDKKLGAMHNTIAVGIGNLGIAYALSGNEKFAAEARRLLLELADRFEGWPVHRHPKFRHDAAKWSWQRLNEAIWLIPSAWGYDLIRNSKSMTDADRKKIENHFIMPCVKSIMRSPGIITAPTNWSVVCNAGVMIGSRVCGNDNYYRKSIDGLTGKRGERGGIFFHLDNGIDDDGMWAEGAIGYQFMAMRGLLVCAEILWRDGIDIYSYRNGRLKLVFDSPIWYCYPGGRRSSAVHDSGSADLFGRDAHLYQYAKQRYGDKTYNAILSKVSPTFESVYNLFLPAANFKPVDAADLPRVPSILFPGVGFTINRTGDGDDSKHLFLDYGPNRSHGHADKLNFTLFALGQELFADAGSAWYSTDIYRRYYPYSQAHNTVTANEMSQIKTGGKLEAYGTLGELAMVRASCDSAIPSVGLDRTMFMADGRLYDIFMVKSGIPFTFDLPYHSFGKLEQSIATEPWKSHPKDKVGYCYFSDTVAAKVDNDWQCSWVVKKGRLNMHYIGEPGSEVIFAKTPKGGSKLPTAMIRRKGKETIYAGAMDIVPTGRKDTIKRVRKLTARNQLGAGLVCDVAGGGEEILLTNFTGGKLKIGAFETDARVAFLRLAGGTLEAFYLAGGTVLAGGGVSVRSAMPTLVAYCEVKDGLAQLANQGKDDTALIITGISQADNVNTVDRRGKRTGSEAAGMNGTTLKLTAKAYTSYELTRGAQPTVVALAEKARRAKIEAQLAREKKEREAFMKLVDAQYADARKSGVPKDFVQLIEVDQLKNQSGGKVRFTTGKAATVGLAFSGWDNHNHALEYEFDIKQAGHYQVILKYCREGGPAKRSIEVNGRFPFDGAEAMEVAGTGGWSNGADNWRLFTIEWPLVNKPFLVKLNAGKNTIRLNNVGGGGVNLDYIAITAPFAEPTKDNLEKK